MARPPTVAATPIPAFAPHVSTECEEVLMEVFGEVGEGVIVVVPVGDSEIVGNIDVEEDPEFPGTAFKFYIG
jgi:hypothetical protein